MTALIDPEELPFTSEEVYEAALQFHPPDAARRLADHLAECGPEVIAGRRALRRQLRASRYPRADRRPSGAWELPAELLPALEKLSESAARRVARLRRYYEEFAPLPSRPTRLTVKLIEQELKRIGATGRLARGLVTGPGITGDDIVDAFAATPTDGGNDAFDEALRRIIERRRGAN